ncbi:MULTISPECIES: SDR family NAD(P)-dependent oxidoreductase [unclassified Streptomyces]|uniref:SDR family NAD(P)-dependent oxidoreductase n=1 Tax=unclassified Streptomyces TaxID=2593676 RepID=UPI001BE98129|nr:MULTISPECIES: SDR family NAD(P)-dependent oxidoreductase [unclassified Streptomyces]MBT2404443.1 SDR family NAD(P)-dependent oxidoreductase [Streptomyces sp. ISL-21]MBT2612503.1 SDR family NAD(P)-dependent oxidoreductase [Streptomyces sp. ISL-87]
MDNRLERLLLDLKADRVSREYVKQYLRNRQEPADATADAPDAVPPAELLRCHSVWRAADGPATGRKPGHVVLLAGPSELEHALRQQDATIDVRLLRSGATGLADRYADLAGQVLTSLRSLAGDPELPSTLVQLVCSLRGEDTLLSGLIGMIRSAGLENPGIVPQLVLVDLAAAPEPTALQILASRERSDDRVVRFRDGVREVLTWHELPSPEHTALPWREGGTYVVTGGLGGLGLIFARDLLRSVRNTSLLLSGRSAPGADRRHLLESLYRPHARVEYTRLDVADPDGVEAYLAGVRREHGAIHGIIHGAGVLRDGFVSHKSVEELREVLAPKTAGTLNLDAASKDDALDFFALFSSTAAVTGNVGQADYAAANAFLDAFAHHRGGLVAQGLRSGRSLSLNWPLWAEGGMRVDAETERELREQTGMHALRTESGIRVFHESLGSDHFQVMAVEGDGPRIRRTLLRQQAATAGSAPVPAPAVAEDVDIDDEVLRDRIVRRLGQMLSAVIGLPVAKIDARVPLTTYGIDSIVVTRLNRKLADVFPDLPKTLLYEFNSLDALARHLLRARRQGCLDWTGTEKPRQAAAAARPAAASAGGRQVPAAASPTSAPTEDAVAVIGMSGRFPMARNLREFWENLATGRDCVTEIPEGRWPLEGFYHPDRDEAVAAGLSYGKWGGFLDGFDEFDPLFFAISPQEAMSMDPQERLFLQESWNALEDGGYTRQRLADAHRRKVGVFAGVSKTGFDLYGPELRKRNEKLHPLTSFASVANRVSYLLDLTGPSLPVDTLCSSSLSAVHEAIQHLLRGECDLAVAGGVNLYLHPSNYTLMSGKRMLSDDGRCRSFGAGGNGFVPGEGVAVVLLKRLSDAERDNDNIRAVLRGSSVNHGGRTNGYTVPSPVAQAEVVREALARAGVSAGEVSFVEAHGTGTELGDPIEIDGLTQAFASDTGSRQHCAIGSLKSNIGHLEAAAGIAGLLKVVLQMEHGSIAAGLHARESNPNIDFTRTPFRLQREKTEWPRPAVVGGDGETTEGDRIAGVSSFGAGGSNAHVVVAEYRRTDPAPVPAPEGAPRLIVLSAKDTERLRERARDLLDWFHSQDPAALDLGAVAHTLQLGREAMDARLALSVGSPAELIRKLAAFAAGEEDVEDLHLGNVKEHREALTALGDDGDMATTVDLWIEKGKFDRLLGLWVKGLSVDWGKLYGSQRPRMLPLPGYPFARERYWVGDLTAEPAPVDSGAGRLHPLVHTNTSTLDAQRFDSVFSGREPFLTDHVVNGRKVLPAAAYLEMARAALDASLDGRTRRTVLRNVVWAQPLTVAENAARLVTTLYTAEAESAGEVTFEISGVPEGDLGADAVVHSQGTVRALAGAGEPAAVDVAALRAACGAARLDAEECYHVYRSMGLDYGPAHRGIESVAIGDGQALARLRLPSGTTADADGYVLHPSLLDAALQSTVGLFGRDGAPAGSAPATLHLPFALDELDVLGPCTPQMWAWVRYGDGDRPDLGIRKLDIDLLDDAGVPRCRLRGLTSRAYAANGSAERAGGTLPHREAASPAVAVAEDRGPLPAGTLEERVGRYLVDFLASELRVPAERIDPDDALEQYGIDSIMAMNLTNRLEGVFGSLSKTLFYEYQSITALSGYFLGAHRPRLAELLAAEAQEPSGAPVDAVTSRGGAGSGHVRRTAARRGRREPAGRDTEIAVIGLAGRYPQARNIREFWRNLADGRDSVTEIPADRWDHGPYFDPDKDAPGKTYTKWGGFLDGVDRFDSLFFNISPREAAFMDPQERLFLECVHETMEDAGYTRETLSHCDDRGLPGNVGVFVGVMYEEYQLYGAQEQARGRNVTLSGSASTIANRVSYVFDLHGPSLAVDTMCSSSLTALHLACQSLRTGGCELAVAGGVNLSLHPNKFLMLGSGKYASSKGRCESFGQGGDGYVPGEGVGAVLLKPLARAREDNDTIYGVIRATSVNHGGKTNGYAVPNPRAQHNVIGHALREAGVDAEAVSYVEAHGTGTSLGDPIEISGLTSAFREYTDRTHTCAIGSVKSNIGHAESAAGIAALTKVLLQMKHGQLAPSLHSEVLNPHIDFDGSPFYVARELTPWSRPTGADGTATPRIAGISSFGAGGSNAHVIVEEYVPAPRPADGPPAQSGPAAIVLSARTDAGLRAQADQLLRWTTEGEGAATELADIAHTLQSGREAYEERLGLVAATTGELVAKLRAFLDGENGITDVYLGRVARRQDTSAALTAAADRARTLDAALARRAYGEVVKLWTTGLVVDWTKLHDESASAPRRVSMPTYPFQGERHWLADGGAAGQDRAAGPARLHPLLHANTSTLNGQRFTSVYTGEEFFLRDHRVGGKPVLSGAACLELARAAVAASLDEPFRVSKLRNVVWTRPVTLHEPGLTVQVRLRPEELGEVGFEILVPGDPVAGTAEVLHSEGVVDVTTQPATVNPDTRLDLARLRDECRTPGPDADALYATAEARGIGYGPGHRGVRRLWTGAGQVLARIALPPTVRDTRDAYGLHPSTVDAGLQACAGLLSVAAGEEALLLPFAVDEVELLGTCPPEAWAWVRDGAGREGDGLRRIDIDVCDDDGRVCLRLKGVALRAHTAAPTTPRELFAVPHWVAADPAQATAPVPEGLVLVVDLPEVAAELETRDTARVVRLTSGATDVGHRYTDHALQVFDEVKRLLGEPAHHPVRVQLVAPAVEASLWTGLAAILRSAGLENPRLLGQMVLVDRHEAPERAASRVTADRAALADFGVRYLGGLREVLKWRVEDVDRRTAVTPWKDGGVYLITGGAGGLGTVFAHDIAKRARGARIVIAGRAPRDAHKDTLLERLREHGAETAYVQADVAVRDDVVRLVRETRERYGRIDGVLHAAGFTSDAFVIKKDADEFSRVLAPKVAGLVHLDEATQDADLDFLVAFSSVAGALGNVGQADYAAANAFMDAFAAHRNARVARGERRGRTLSVAWPLWADGGMGIDAPTERALRDRFGLVPLPDEEGLRALYLALASPSDHVMVLSGDRPKIARTLLAGLLVDGPAPRPLPSPDVPAAEVADGNREAAPAEGPDETTAQQAVTYFKRLLASVIDLPADRIDAEAPLEDYGVDSVMTMEMTRTLEEVFGSLPKTLFFEYRTISALTRHLLKTHPRQVGELLPPAGGSRQTPAVAPGVPERPVLTAGRTRPVSSAAPARRGADPAPGTGTGDTAIIGLAGRYPQARDVREFWQNLAAGKDCVTEIPDDRWDHRRFFDPRKGAPGKSYSRWGGFLDGAYDFDPQFFNISPREAEIMDPQERLFLQCVHETLEDAGYVRDTGKDRTGNLLDGRVGVFVGVMYQEYQLHSASAQDAGAGPIVSGSSASVANRVSHVFNFHGPSMSVDTMCSSSLMAVHLACRSLESGDCDTAVAGGVNLSLHPNKYLLLSQGRLASSDGRCASFGAGGDGYAPAEGVGAILLKPLARAVADGDRIYGVIKGTAANHRGRTSGYSVPEPVGQAEVIGEALRRAGVNARDVSYIDANSVGTSLGDPIEIAGLCKAFGPYTDDRGFCAIGSVKSNIGHAESAAGIAGITKVLLQLQHGRLAPSLHASTPNPHIDFGQTPFVVQQESAEWPSPVSDDGTGRTLPRVAGVSAFGAGGSNVHVVMAEYVPDSPPQPVPAAADPRAVIPLSARTTEQLRARAEQLAQWLGRPENADLALADVAHTLQVGREPREERLGVVASSVPDLVERLGRFLADDFAGGEIVRGSITGAARTLTLFASDSDLDVMIAAWAEKGKYEKLLELWVSGVPVNWRSLHGTATARRVALPAYPFAAERYSAFDGLSTAGSAAPGGPAPLHPLAQVNTSDFTEQRFTSVVTGEERFLGERAARVVPGAALLEMAVAASCLGSRAAVEPSAPVVLRDIVFARPLDPADGPREVHVGLRPEDDGDIRFRITSTPPGGGDCDAVEHGEGVLYFADGAEETVLDLPALRRACGTSVPTAEQYEDRRHGDALAQEPAYRAVRRVWTGLGQALVQLALPDPVRDTEDGLVLHPGLLDAAVRACSDALGGSAGRDRAYDGGGPAVVRAIEEVLVLDACTPSMWAWVRPGAQQAGQARVPGFDLDLADEQGRVRVRIGGLSIDRAASDRDDPAAAVPAPGGEPRAATPAGGTEARGGQPVLLSRQWRARPAPARPSGLSAARQTVLLAGLPELEPLLRGDDADVFLLTTEDEAPDSRYTAYGLQVLTHLRSLLRGSTGRHQVQLVVPGTPDATLLSGLAAVLRTAGLENPAVTGQVVVLDRTDTPERAVVRIRENLGCPEEMLVRYVEGRREVPVWAEHEARSGPGTLPWKENGVYLVAGATGALEQDVAQEIATQTGNATVILVGRSPLAPASHEALRKQAADGAVRYEQADLSSPAEADALVARILERHWAIDGVIHSAGTAGGALIVDTPGRDFRDVLAAEAAGVVNLDAATRSLPLDFFVTFSSPSGVDGGIGQVDGAAAHAFLNAYARYRQDLVAGGERFGHSQSVIWPSGDDGLPEAADVGDFNRILRSEHSQVRVPASPAGHTRGDTPVPTQRNFPAFSTDGTDS